MKRPASYIILVLLLSHLHAYAQDTVHVLFVYGSKPAAKGEDKWFGGKHGGHVSIQYGNAFASFVPKGKFHLFSKKKQIHSKFVLETGGKFIYDTSDSRFVLISIPIDSHQRKSLDSVIARRLKRSPYDYAFFGMRCASAAYELLSSARIFPTMSRPAMIRRFFYPKKLRKLLLREASRKHWPVYYRPGRETRKWERE